MTFVTLFRSPCGWEGFRARGHTGYADHGEDIVCAAVSALTQTAVLGLEETLAIAAEVAIEDGQLSCFLPKFLDQEKWEHGQILLDTVFRGLKAIADEYGQFVKVEEVESCG